MNDEYYDDDLIHNNIVESVEVTQFLPVSPDGLCIFVTTSVVLFKFWASEMNGSIFEETFLKFFEFVS